MGPVFDSATSAGALRLERAMAAWGAGAAAPPDAETVAGATAVILVEGESDRAAVREAARLLGVGLLEAGVAVIPMGGAMSVRRFMTALGGGSGPRDPGDGGPSTQGDGDDAPASAAASLPLRGLCDAAEVRFFERAGVREVFVCRPDLEGELIAALGVAAVEEALEDEGDLRLLRRFQRQPAQRGRAPEEQLHRFLGTTSGRKEQYARVLTSRLTARRVPSALRGVLGG